MRSPKTTLWVFLALALLVAGCQAPAQSSSEAAPSSLSQPAQEGSSSQEESIPSQESPSSGESTAPQTRPDGLPIFPQETLGENTPASFLGKTFGDVVACYGEDYQMEQVNSQFLNYQLDNGASLNFHCSAPGEWGTFDANDPVTYISVWGAQGTQVTRDISLGMTREEVTAAMPEGLESSSEEGPGAGNQWNWYGELNGSLCRILLSFGEDGTLQSVDIKGEELMDQLASVSYS